MEKHITPLSASKATIGPSLPGKISPSTSFNDLLKGQVDGVKSQQSATAAKGSVILVGKISNEHKTVSELLIQHHDLRSSSWQILSSEHNLKKDYTSLQPGTNVYYNAKDGSLTWSPSTTDQSERLTKNSTPSMPSSPQAANHQGKEQLGIISRNTPTVSHLLHSHPTLKDETWSILNSAINMGKDFTRLPAGTEILIDPLNKEISWQGRGQLLSRTIAHDAPGTIISVAPDSKATARHAATHETLPVNADQPVLLGTIDNTDRTVSHLLAQHPQSRGRTYEFLTSSINHDKPFHRIPIGTSIYLNPKTLELTWNVPEAVTTVSRKVATVLPQEMPQERISQVQTGNKAADLTEAVQPYLGTSYSEINCYELLVKGLRGMDIPYGGKDGLFTKLTAMARDRGMPVNAYLNGEGIVKAAGSMVFSKSYSNMTNWQEDAERLFGEIKPLLDRGQILSFSTENRGHTGIVSQQDNQWTFINSGRQDNPVAMKTIPRGVGEEILHKEIHNWFKLAHSKKETLMVTLGRLEQEKMRTALHMPERLSNRI